MGEVAFGTVPRSKKWHKGSDADWHRANRVAPNPGS